jgi:FKBP-type peptidyl-prolyl cis-trans isomerase FkpA
VARSTRLRLGFGLLLLLLAATLLAWFGAGQMRGETFASGLEVRTLVAGEGPLVTAEDGVVIEYVGTLPDGTEFESTAGRPTPMLVNQVVPGFSEALQQMQKGGRYKIRIPAAQAYGANPPPGSPIPPNTDLLFDIKVLEVVRNAASMANQGPQLPGM